MPSKIVEKILSELTKNTLNITPEIFPELNPGDMADLLKNSKYGYLHVNINFPKTYDPEKYLFIIKELTEYKHGGLEVTLNDVSINEALIEFVNTTPLEKYFLLSFSIYLNTDSVDDSWYKKLYSLKEKNISKIKIYSSNKELLFPLPQAYYFYFSAQTAKTPEKAFDLYEQALTHAQNNEGLQNKICFEMTRILIENENVMAAYQIAEQIPNPLLRQHIQAELIDIDANLPLSLNEKAQILIYLSARPAKHSYTELLKTREAILQQNLYLYQKSKSGEQNIRGKAEKSFFAVTGADGAISCDELFQLAYEIGLNLQKPESYSLRWFYSLLRTPVIKEACIHLYGSYRLLPLEQLLTDPSNTHFIEEKQKENNEEILPDTPLSHTTLQSIETTLLPKIAGMYATNQAEKLVLEDNSFALAGLTVACESWHVPPAYRILSKYHTAKQSLDKAQENNNHADYYEGYALTESGKDLIKENNSFALQGAIAAMEATQSIEHALFLALVHHSKQITALERDNKVPLSPELALKYYRKAIDFGGWIKATKQIVKPSQFREKKGEPFYLLCLEKAESQEITKKSTLLKAKLYFWLFLLYFPNSKAMEYLTKLENLLTLNVEDTEYFIRIELEICYERIARESPQILDPLILLANVLKKDLIPFECWLKTRNRNLSTDAFKEYFFSSNSYHRLDRDLDPYVDFLKVTNNLENVYQAALTVPEKYILFFRLLYILEYNEKEKASFFAKSAEGLSADLDGPLFELLHLHHLINLIHFANETPKKLFIEKLFKANIDWCEFRDLICCAYLGDPSFADVITSIASQIIAMPFNINQKGFYDVMFSGKVFELSAIMNFFLQNLDQFAKQEAFHPYLLQAAKHLAKMGKHQDAMKCYQKLSSSPSYETIAQRRLYGLEIKSDDDWRSFEALWNKTQNLGFAERAAVLFEHYERQFAITRFFSTVAQSFGTYIRAHGDKAQTISSTLRQHLDWDEQDVLKYFESDELSEILKHANLHGRLTKMFIFVEEKCLNTQAFRESNLSEGEGANFQNERFDSMEDIRQYYKNLKMQNNIIQLKNFANHLRETTNRLCDKVQPDNIQKRKDLLKIVKEVEEYNKSYQIQYNRLSDILNKQLSRQPIVSNNTTNQEIVKKYQKLKDLLNRHQHNPLSSPKFLGGLVAFLDRFKDLEHYEPSVSKQVRKLIEILAPSHTIAFDTTEKILTLRTDSINMINEWFSRCEFNGKYFAHKLVPDGMSPINFLGNRPKRLEIALLEHVEVTQISSIYNELLSEMVRQDFIDEDIRQAILKNLETEVTRLQNNQVVLGS